MSFCFGEKRIFVLICQQNKFSHLVCIFFDNFWAEKWLSSYQIGKHTHTNGVYYVTILVCVICSIVHFMHIHSVCVMFNCIQNMLCNGAKNNYSISILINQIYPQHGIITSLDFNQLFWAQPLKATENIFYVRRTWKTSAEIVKMFLI